MPRPESTEIIVHEDGTEEHPSWLLVRANRISSTGTRLFDSEIKHQHYIRVTVSRCTRTRDLYQDWLHSTQILIEIDMSEAQWGAFVSSFGNGSGVPATLSTLMGKQVPGTPVDSRLNQSHEDVHNAATKAVEEVKQAHRAVAEAFNENMGKKVMRDRMNMLNSRIQNLPANMEFAAKSLTEHTENVVTKARADIEAMSYQAAKSSTEIESGLTSPLTLGTSWHEGFDKELPA